MNFGMLASTVLAGTGFWLALAGFALHITPLLIVGLLLLAVGGVLLVRGPSSVE